MNLSTILDGALAALWIFPERYPEVFVLDLLRYVVGAGSVFFIVNIALARWLARRKIRITGPQKGQIKRELAASLRTVAIFAAFGTLVGIGAHFGLIPIYRDVAEYGYIWLIASTIIIIVSHDAWFYWTHRLMHRPGMFRWFHRLHHKSHNPTPFTSYSFDASEAAMNALFFPLILLIIPAHPIALVIFTTHMMLRNAIGHCGYEIFPAGTAGKPLFGWLATVTHHDLHHENARYNMGLYFTWWDRWMGTEHPDYLSRFAATARPFRHGKAVMLLLVNFAIAGGSVAAVEFAPAPAVQSQISDIRPSSIAEGCIKEGRAVKGATFRNRLAATPLVCGPGRSCPHFEARLENGDEYGSL